MCQTFALLSQEELNNIRNAWNVHCIRSSKNTNVPYGTPDVMFMAPPLWDEEDHIVPLKTDDLTSCNCKFLNSVPCDEDMFDLCTLIMEETGLQFPSTRAQALSVRHSVRSELIE